ncbi:LOW QUALITY PROTEIN: damage-control phosphatase ARMT1 [Drosophila obscura]|uniref:LOW QUALITY PROTEIN: damage-control phosphatase ARMT1 n=1 Tax=Drosophila obscura TaxID=7282 RepID=UPI001BB22A6F|nr:LOW QUALITY PROTEIN: damage-control phosphatase ARMT1 [Drosophila obscura]
MTLRISLGNTSTLSGKTTESEFQEGPTPRHSLLSGRFKQSFAYLSLRTRMPGIMQQIIVRLLEGRPELETKFGVEIHKEIQHVIDAIERLKMELNRDRQFLMFHGNEPDKAAWNAFITELPRHKRTFFRACWLHSECYLYRRIYSFVENTKHLAGFDYFAHLKQDDLKISKRAMQALTTATRNLPKDYESFSKLMRINLWSNHYEIQLNAYVFQEDEEYSDLDVLTRVADLDRNLLVDDSILVWNCLMKAKGSPEIVVDFVCDNGGFELFTDMLLIEYLVANGLATLVRLHVKAIPWYISDVNSSDIEWTIHYLIGHSDELLSALGRKWARLFNDGKIIIAPKSHFWTGPQPYFVMVDSDQDLYKLLSGGSLAIFKGDLNYRKLMGDYIWDSTEDFITCLRGFRPCNICAMRTVKCEVICGLPEGKSDALLRSDPQWMISGNYGVIQYTDSLKCPCYQVGRLSGISHSSHRNFRVDNKEQREKPDQRQSSHSQKT